MESLSRFRGNVAGTLSPRMSKLPAWPSDVRMLC